MIIFILLIFFIGATLYLWFVNYGLVKVCEMQSKLLNEAKETLLMSMNTVTKLDEQ